MYSSRHGAQSCLVTPRLYQMVLAAAAGLRGGAARNGSTPEVVMVPAKVEPDFGRSKPALLSSRFGRLSFRLVQVG